MFDLLALSNEIQAWRDKINEQGTQLRLLQRQNKILIDEKLDLEKQLAKARADTKGVRNV